MILKIKPGRFARAPQGNQSRHHSLHDGMSGPVMVGAGETYFTAFALFLKRIRDKGQVYRPRLRREFIFRMTRFNAFMGLMYDYITVSRSERDRKVE